MMTPVKVALKLGLSLALPIFRAAEQDGRALLDARAVGQGDP